MLLNGYISHYKRRNEKTGESWFCFVVGNSVYHCHGTIIKYPYRLPITLECADNGSPKMSEVKSARFYNDEKHIIEFLKTKEFDNFGEKYATTLLNKIKKDTGSENIDIFAYVRDYNKKLFTDNENKALGKLRHYSLYQDFYDYLVSKNFDFFNVSKIYSIYGSDTMDVVNSNPYIMLMSGAEITVCESLAKDNGMEYCDRKRIRGIVEYIMIRNNKNGNSRMLFTDLLKNVDKLCDQIQKYNKENNINCYTEPIEHIFIAEEVLSRRYVLIQNEDDPEDLYVYFRMDYETEVGIKNNILKLIENKEYFYNTNLIDEIEDSFNIHYSENQKRAFDLISSSGIKLLTGDPGSGKTTVINGILYAYRKNNPAKTVALCAPTGCAARRLQESTSNVAVTIHRLLDIRPYTNLLNNKTTQLTQDLIIVDEASMVDMYIAYLLLSSIKPGAIVIFVGDPNQLEPVGVGDFFSSMINSQKFEHCHLDTIFRQNARSDIVVNSKKVSNRDTYLIRSNSFRILKFDQTQSIIDTVKKYAESCYQRNVDFTLFTPVKKTSYDVSSINMNRQLSNIYCSVKNNEYIEENEVFFGVYIFRIGDKVIFNQNNYEKGFFNGMSGIVTCIQKFNNSVYVSIKTDDDVEITLKDNELEYIELGYAITAHKAQGSECDNALIVVPLKPLSMLQKRLLYVEITRARKNVIILSEKNALEKAIINSYERKRITGLKDLLNKIY